MKLLPNVPDVAPQAKVEGRMKATVPAVNSSQVTEGSMKLTVANITETTQVV